MSAHRIDGQLRTLWDTESRIPNVIVVGVVLATASMVSGWFFHGLLLALGAWVVWVMILELRARLLESDLAFVPSILVGVSVLFGVCLARG